MTIGEKIRKARTQRGFTQAQLGSMIGVPGDMIRKYENDVRTPKEQRLALIADKLNVDLSSLSETNIENSEGILHALFELEETIGLDISASEDMISLTLKNDGNLPLLFSYLNDWYNKKIALSSNKLDKANYIDWKLRFPLDLNSQWKKTLLDIDTHYLDLKESIKESAAPIQYSSEFIMLLKEMLDDNLYLDINNKFLGVGSSAIEIRFKADELLNSKEPLSNFIAKFLTAIDSFKNWGMNIDSYFCLEKDTTYVNYLLCLSPLGVVSELINEYKQHLYTSKEGQSDNDNFENIWISKLKQYNLNIHSEISFYEG